MVIFMGRLYDDLSEPSPDRRPKNNRMTRADIMASWDTSVKAENDTDLLNTVEREKREKKISEEVNFTAIKEKAAALERQSRVILFYLDGWGIEASNLLPPMIGYGQDLQCDYVESDEKVQTVMEKTKCHPQDACWALEAHKGNVFDAVISIDKASRRQTDPTFETTNTEKDVIEIDDDSDWDGAWFKKMTVEEEKKERLEILAEKECQEEIKRKRFEGFGGGEVDGKWLPTKNPNPVEDEPWFTG